MEEMVSNIRQNADNAQQTEKIAVKSAEDAKRRRPVGGRGGQRHEGDRQQDLHHRGDRAADQHAGPQRGHRSGPRRRTRQGLRGGGRRGAQTGRTQPEGGRRDQPALDLHRESGGEGRRDAGKAGAEHSEDRRTGAGDQRRQQRAEHRRRADQQGAAAAADGDPAERLGRRGDGLHQRRAVRPGRRHDDRRSTSSISARRGRVTRSVRRQRQAAAKAGGEDGCQGRAKPARRATPASTADRQEERQATGFHSEPWRRHDKRTRISKGTDDQLEQAVRAGLPSRR